MRDFRFFRIENKHKRMSVYCSLSGWIMPAPKTEVNGTGIKMIEIAKTDWRVAINSISKARWSPCVASDHMPELLNEILKGLIQLILSNLTAVPNT